ncbi:hypothetical protein C6Y11_14785 [Lactiplantibacillus pentosus]|uniref:MFS transporter n=2 Tax=Lactiplantibacillus pentosus TaxID=1589 RepID=UPI000D021B56|nr:MFS transporter [Lactiplantibacillus pentosus]MCT3284208.1 hypothetical protein [Lactiplantibacillus pentosus]MCT3303480.1 hypothetical protein [Lactiplantibacillus pentosus]PRO76350.1 hypothetical protein C6Y11_14785 [Lactiplantibacillus pentosus]PRO79369.1 hypothetical protein C6Y09_09305 [Lactiplantibacillus pentosus]PRO89790.1 hypothetical protein C6Y12_12760 [Lactiplantibacillus pentosus]
MVKGVRGLNLLVTAESISNFGDGIWIILMPLLGYNLWHSSLAIGIVSLVTLSPYVLGILFSNYVDRMVPPVVMIICDVGRMLLSFLLAVLLLSGRSTFVLFIVLVFLLSSFSVFYIPSRTAAVPNFFKKEVVQKTEAIFNVSDFLFLVVGKLFCGFLLGISVSYGLLVLIDSFTFLVSGFCNYFFYKMYVKKVIISKNNTVIKSKNKIFKIFLRQDLKMILASFVILNLSIGGLMENALPTILIKNNPTNYKQWFSILNSSFDIGMLVSNLIFLKIFSKSELNTKLIAIPGVVSLLVIGLFLSPNILKFFLIFSVGGLASWLDVATVVYMQTNLPRESLTSTFTVIGSVSKTLEPISSLIYMGLCLGSNIYVKLISFNLILLILASVSVIAFKNKRGVV